MPGAASLHPVHALVGGAGAHAAARPHGVTAAARAARRTGGISRTCRPRWTRRCSCWAPSRSRPLRSTRAAATSATRTSSAPAQALHPGTNLRQEWTSCHSKVTSHDVIILVGPTACCAPQLCVRHDGRSRLLGSCPSWQIASQEWQSHCMAKNAGAALKHEVVGRCVQ